MHIFSPGLLLPRQLHVITHVNHLCERYLGTRSRRPQQVTQMLSAIYRHFGEKQSVLNGRMFFSKQLPSVVSAVVIFTSCSSHSLGGVEPSVACRQQQSDCSFLPLCFCTAPVEDGYAAINRRDQLHRFVPGLFFGGSAAQLQWRPGRSGG